MAFNFSSYDNQLLFIPLGGSNEIGMNLNLYRYQSKWLIIDLGIGFADDYLPGIDVVLPNIDMLLEHKEDVLGLVLTHAHEDHLGGVAYLWDELRCPIYATPFTAEVLGKKMSEARLTSGVTMHNVKPGEQYQLGPFTLDAIPLTHSIPEMHAIAITTDKGTILHTGDWKLDNTPLVGPTSDEATLNALGDKGVLAMVCDSTNVFLEGESGSESDVRHHLTEVIKACENRVFVTTFASNIARLESVIYSGLEAGRSVALAGKSLWRITAAAQACGYLKDIPPFLHDKEAMELPRDKCMVICTGCQGEGRAALTKIVRDEHPVIRTTPGDTVVFSSKIIPGNETKIGWLHNQLVLKGLEVITEKNAFIHVSGHPGRAELERMYQLVRPTIAVPVHGEARHIQEHAYLAKQLQVPEAVEATNGAVILLEAGKAGVVGHVESGYIAVDGKTLIDTNSPIISMRRKIRDEGVVLVSIVLDKKLQLTSEPFVTAPGCLDDSDDRELVGAIIEEVSDGLDKLKGSEKEARIQELVRAAVRRVVRSELGKKPVIQVHVHRL